MSDPYLQKCRRRSVVARSIKVSLIVGTILTAINQGDVVLAGHSPNYWKMALTYLVPYLVSTYAAVSAMSE